MRLALGNIGCKACDIGSCGGSSNTMRLGRGEVITGFALHRLLYPGKVDCPFCTCIDVRVTQEQK